MLDGIVFDIGGVLIFHDDEVMYGRICNLLKYPPHVSQIKRDIQSSGISTGKRTPRELFQILSKRYCSKADYDEWSVAWTGHFSLNTETIDYVETLMLSGMQCHICSNINSLHWHVIEALYPAIFRNMKSIWLSYRIGLQKPDRRIFALMADYFGSLKNILFVDDKSENTDAAYLAGFKVHTFSSQELLAEAVDNRRCANA